MGERRAGGRSDAEGQCFSDLLAVERSQRRKEGLPKRVDLWKEGKERGQQTIWRRSALAAAASRRPLVPPSTFDSPRTSPPQRKRWQTPSTTRTRSTRTLSKTRPSERQRIQPDTSLAMTTTTLRPPRPQTRRTLSPRMAQGQKRCRPGKALCLGEPRHEFNVLTPGSQVRRSRAAGAGATG